MLVSKNTVAFVEYFGNCWSKLSTYILGVSLSVFYLAFFFEGYVSYINSFRSKMKMNEIWLARTDKLDESLATYILYTQYAQCWGTVPFCCFLLPLQKLRFPCCYVLLSVSTNDVSCVPLLKQAFLGFEALPFTKCFCSIGRQSRLKSIDKWYIRTFIKVYYCFSCCRLLNLFEMRFFFSKCLAIRTHSVLTPSVTILV